MKILESKYYTPRKIFTEKYVNNQPQILVKDLETEVTISNTPYEELISSLMTTINFNDDEIVIKREALQDFVQCTDYHLSHYSKKTNSFYRGELCYFYPEYAFFLIMNENLSSTYDKHIFEAGYLRVEHLGYDSKNPASPKNIEAFFERYLEKYVSPDAKISLLLKDGDNLVFKSHSIKPYALDLATMYNDDFLPVHKKIKHDLVNSNKGVVMLHGIAGSGKTNYIKWLTAQIPEKDFIFVPNNLIGMLAEPQFMSMLIEQQNSVLVLEDCENYIAERSGGGNTSDVVSTILNIADGILSDVLECQFICTFNADLLDVDPALLRRGRLIAQYQFDKLSVDKANTYLAAVGKSIRVDAPKTLAEVTNIDEKHYQQQSLSSSFGFV